MLTVEGRHTTDKITMKYWALLSEGRVAQRITRLTTDQKIPGSNPGVVVSFEYFFIKDGFNDDKRIKKK